MLGNIARAESGYERARILYEESRDLCQELGDRQGLAYVFWYLGRLTLYEDEITVAQALLEKGLELARGRKRGADRVGFTDPGFGRRHQADYETAQALLVESLGQARESGEKEIMSKEGRFSFTLSSPPSPPPAPPGGSSTGQSN